MLARCGATSWPTWSALSAGHRLAKHVQPTEVPDVLWLCIVSKRALSIPSLGALSIEAGSGSQHKFATCVVRGRASFIHFLSQLLVWDVACLRDRYLPLASEARPGPRPDVQHGAEVQYRLLALW